MDINFLDVTTNEANQQNDKCNNMENLIQSYLELKKKICKTHEVIKQYNDKLKECERLKSELDAASKQTKKVTLNYNSSLAKVIKLELQNTEYKKNIETLAAEVNNHKIKAAADQQHIQQLVCKIKDVESQQNDLIMQHDLKKSSLEMKVKELEQELKTVKKTYDMKIKKMEKKTSIENNSIHKSNNSSNNDSAVNICNKVKMEDVGTITVLSKDEIMQKPQVSNKYTMTNEIKIEITKKPQVLNKCIITDEFYSVKDDMYPIFCAKCEVNIEPIPLEKIFKVMINSCPKLIDKISSPLKKILPPVTLPSSSNTVTERCGSQSLIALPETLPLRILNTINHPAVTYPNQLPPQASVESTGSNCCNNSLMSSFINPICIESTPVNSTLIAKNTTNQSTQCDELSMVTPSRSIISLLQKRVDMLDKKLKKKLNKRKLELSSNCSQHLNSYYVCDINNSIQTNFMQLWQRMADFYVSKKKEQHIVNKLRNRNLNKCKLSRLKSIKRLQNVCAESTWKVETLTTKGEPSSIRKRPETRKYKHSMLLKKPEVPIEVSEDLDKSDSDLVSNSCNDTFTNTDDIIIDAINESKNESCIETTSSTCNNDLQVIAVIDEPKDVDAPEILSEVKNSIECNKSVNGETDSGILSDSVESSNKLIQLEADLDTCFAPQNSKTLEDQSFENSIPCATENSNSMIPEPTEKSSSEVVIPNIATEEVTESEISRPCKEIDNTKISDPVPQNKTSTSENTDNMEINDLISQIKTSTSENINNVEINDLIPQIKIPTFEKVTGTRKRKISQLEETKKCGRQQLFKKIKNLKKCRTISNAHLNTSNHHEIGHGESKNSCALVNDHLKKEVEDVEEDDSILKKKLRIAHIPKVTTTEPNVSLNNCAQVRVSVGENMTNKKENLETVTINHINLNKSPVVKLTKLTFRNSINSYNLPVTSTAVKESNNQKLNDKCSDSTNKSELQLINILSSDTAAVVKTNDSSKESTTDTKSTPKNVLQEIDLFGDVSDNSEDFDSPKIPDNSFGESMEVNETDTKLTGECDFESPKIPDDSFGESMEVNKANAKLTGECDFEFSKSPDDSFGESMEVNEAGFKLIEKSVQLKKEKETDLSSLDKPIINTCNNINEFDNQMKCKESDKFNESSTLNAILTNNLQSQHYQNNVNQYKNPTIVKSKLSTLRKKVKKDKKKDQSRNFNNSLNFNNVQRSNRNKITKIHPKKITCTTQKKFNLYSPFAILKELATDNFTVNRNYKELQHLEKIRSIADKSVRNQLRKLMHDEWNDTVHWDVIEKLKSTYTSHIIAKNIVDYLSIEQQVNQDLDNTYTPPAPLMTRAQQRISALLIDLEKSIPMIIQLVQSGIEYKLLKLNQQTQKLLAVESLARMYVILARIKKDRQKVRIFCCDALYCSRLCGILVLYTIFTCWPESFPKYKTNKDPLPKCVAHLILAQQAKDLPKLSALKNLLSVYYNYPSGTLSTNILKELLTALQEKCHPEIEASIKLLAKKEGLEWTYKNIIKGALLPMIINGKLSNMYRAFGLLGDLLRVFPIEDKNNSVGEIVQQLCDLISSGEGSDEQQEGVISALLSLSRHKFDTVLSNVIKWTPAAPLHDRTVAQINGIFNLRELTFWISYIRKYENLKSGKQNKI